jgi:hypothetical protein
MSAFNSFVEFVERVVIPRHAVNPSDLRLDGQLTGGNRLVAGTFRHAGREWLVHSDTHYERLMLAHDANRADSTDPFVEQRTPRGNSLDLTPALRRRASRPGRKYLYIYER